MIRSLVLVGALCALGATAHAEPVEIALKNKVPPGVKPSLDVKALDDLIGVRLELERDDGEHFTVEHGPLRTGQSASLAFGDGKAGHAAWKGKLILHLPSGNRSTTELTFETGTVGELKVTYARDHLDLDAHVIEFQLSRPAGRAEIRVVADDGSELGSGQATFHREPAGTWLRLPWTQRICAAGQSGCNVLKLELKASDADGLSARVELTPWSVRIAHEEVIFETAKWEIRPSEIAKLDASYARIIDAVAQVRKAAPELPVKLFVAGHTDTVGRPDDNRRLSLERARAIGTFFRQRGLPLPIAYAGFGEEALKVKTPDNTDEPANRRADYIVGVDEPQVGLRARAEWRRLP